MSDTEDFGNLANDEFSGEAYFPTLIFKTVCDGHLDMNRYLLEKLYCEREKDKEGLEKSNFRELGGWHSHSNLHTDSSYRPIVERIDAAGMRMSEILKYHPSTKLKIGTMWAIINGKGSFNRAHIHPQSHWSGVYYVQGPDCSGNIEFIDPRTENFMNALRYDAKQKKIKETWTKVQFQPIAGTMLIFPSWLYHSVAPNLAEGETTSSDRVIISFNLSQLPR